jgi:TIR domain-containing protein
VPRPVRLFISHSHRDAAFVKRLTHVLDGHGLSYWYSRHHIVGAQQWHDEIGRALTRCNWFVLVLSPAAVASKWVKHELLFALEERAYLDHIVILSVRRARYKRLSWTLHQSQWVDFTRGFDRGCKALLRVWRSD